MRSETLNDGDLDAVAEDLGLPLKLTEAHAGAVERAKVRVDADERSARDSGVKLTPTFFINGRRYDGPWEASSLSDAMLGTLGHRVRSAALNFASWGLSAGVLLFFATVLAVIITSSPLGPAFAAFWELDFGLALGAISFHMSLQHWINDAPLTILLSAGRARDQARVYGRTPGELAVRGASGGRSRRRHGCAGHVVSVDHPTRTMVPWLGCANGNRHGFCSSRDRDDGVPCSRGASHLSDRGRDC
jgi:NhaA family Na+:H+ antiporter